MKLHVAIAIAAILTAGCVGTTRSGIAVPADAPRLTSSTVTFTTLDDGKDTGSAVTAQLVREGNELSAEVRSAGTEYDDRTTAPPLVLSLTGPFDVADTQGAVLRIRLTPEGRDTWTFNVRLALTFSDGSQQTFNWNGVRLDENAPERRLTLAGARI
jgi:hypothetical protein